MSNAILFLEGNAAEGGWMGTIGLFLPFLVVFAIVYFFMIRPEKKRRQQIYNMQKDIVQGDKIVTIGGIYGKVEQLTDYTVTIVVADGTRFKVEKGAIKGKQPEEAPKEQ
ncbi:preprotein translocase subunit YajC [Haloplasma contractile]|uniref:Secreted protein n=1 Tax=Haloplasma contractile SSD-17B TaxID=1033810 RepID=F7PX11_9MOLU|nr:preprotein translocase subunit YajC [Haloplasma contractile]ERJ12750.1 Putative secreted protein [Haloplasma contractile SSD-17B]